MPTRILFMRHGAHKDNVLTAEADKQAFDVGAWLKSNGFVIDYAVASPVGRAQATASKVAEGHVIPDLAIAQNDLLGDIAADNRLPPNAVATLKTKAQEIFGDMSDASLAKAMLHLPEFHSVMMERAQETAELLEKIARDHFEQDVLVVSHAVGRIEIAINWLFGGRDPADVLKITNVTPTCGVYNVVFEDGKAIDERLLDVK